MDRRRRTSCPTFWGLLLLVLAALLLFQGCGPRLPLVGVIQWTGEIQAFGETLQGVIEGLREEGFQHGLNLELQVVNAAEDRARAAEAAQEFQRRGARLLITLGTIPTLIALEVTQESRLPVVYSVVGAPDSTGLARPPEPGRIRFTGTSMEVPAGEQLRFLLLAQPGLKRLGLLYCHATPQAVATGEAAAAAARTLGIEVIRKTIPDERLELLQQALTDLLQQNIAGLFIPTDPVLCKPSNLRVICAAALKARVAVMVPAGELLHHGALLAYHCDFGDIGRQAGRQAAQILGGVPPAQVPPEVPRIKRLSLNPQVARVLGRPLPRQLLCQAHNLWQEVPREGTPLGR